VSMAASSGGRRCRRTKSRAGDVESAWAWKPRRVVVGVGGEVAEQAMWSRRGHGSLVGWSSVSEER
jgi:hypothetical protein